MRELRLESVLVDTHMYEDPLTKSVNTPIYQTSTFRQEQIRGEVEWEYSRSGNPTRAALERLMARLERGHAGFAFASGMAALTAALSLFQAGDCVLIPENVYGGTYRVLEKVFSRFGIRYKIVNSTDLQAVDAAFTEDVKAMLMESPANPLLTVTDIRALSAVVKAHGALLIVDNTFMTPYLQRPIELGADIVVHSATKYLGGHSDVVAGLVVTATPELSERIAFVQNSTGGVLGPFDSYLVLRGIKTLAVRLDRHASNAQRIAEHLSGNPAVRDVYYPGLPGAQGYEIQRAQAKNGGAMISFELQEGYDVPKFFSSLKLITLAESLGGVESLICHPASMTHAAIPEELRRRIGITEGLIRLSVGIEDVDDLIEDLDAAIDAAKA
ncbi:MAG: trans-sulfuration enzyme family protein [Candidatus Faecivicinus sp.]